MKGCPSLSWLPFDCDLAPTGSWMPFAFWVPILYLALVRSDVLGNRTELRAWVCATEAHDLVPSHSRYDGHHWSSRDLPQCCHP